MPDAHAAAARAHVVRPDVDPFEQTLTRRGEDQHDGVDHPAGRRHFVLLTEERLLLVPRLDRRVRDRGLPDQSPGHLLGEFGEVLGVVPRVLVRVEQAALHAPAHVDHAEADVGDEHVRVAAGAEGRLVERDVRERRLRLETDETEGLGDLGDAEEVVAHDAANGLVALGLLDRGRRDDHLDDAPEGVARRFDCQHFSHELSRRQLREVRDLRALREKADEATTDTRLLLPAGEQELLDLRGADGGLDVGHGTSHPQVRLGNSRIAIPFGLPLDRNARNRRAGWC